jgi:hypothetical protein
VTSQIRSLSPAGRWLRGIALVAVVAALVVGTFWGDDDNFPFGPFRMFSTTNTLDGHVDSAEVWGVVTSGAEFEIEWSDIGLRRAEIEGQMPRFIEDPDALRYVAEAYERFNPHAPGLVSVKLRESVQTLKDGRPYGEPVSVLLAQWNAP